MGHFKLLRLIGQGAMGMVIQAEDINLRRIVALKVLRKQLTTGEKGKKAVEQFLREARAAAALEHPNIVRVFEINQHAGWWYIAMEMVEGNSLQAIVKATGCLPPMRACPIIADAAQGLEAAHELGMIHRDIKPGNILVSRNGRGKLTDFGLVRIEDPSDPDDALPKINRNAFVHGAGDDSPPADYPGRRYLQSGGDPVLYPDRQAAVHGRKNRRDS